MPRVFYKLVVSGLYRGETVDTIMHYREETGVGVTFPNTAMMQTVIDRWQAQCEGDYIDVKPSEYAMQSIICSGYNDDGTPAADLPVVEIDTNAGAVTDDMAGPANCALVRARVSGGAVVAAGGRLPRRGRWFVGPIPKTSLDEDGAFDPAAFAAGNWAALEGTFSEALQVAGLDAIFPIIVSMVRDGVGGEPPRLPDVNIMAWRNVTGASTRTRATYRRSRNNGK